MSSSIRAAVATSAILGGAAAFYSIRQKQQTSKVLAAFNEFIKNNTKYDEYNNRVVDLTKLKTDHPDLVVEQLLKNEDSPSKHMLLVQFAPEQYDLHKQLFDSGFTWHQSNRTSMVFKKCFQGHPRENCTYPRYTPILQDVTAPLPPRDPIVFVPPKKKPKEDLAAKYQSYSDQQIAHAKSEQLEAKRRWWNSEPHPDWPTPQVSLQKSQRLSDI